LTTWEPNQKIEDWLIEQLKFQYNLWENITKSWLENNKLLLLLDGLNELEDNQEKCIDAINNFFKKFADIPIVICCRSEEYENSRKKLKLNTIYLHDLNKNEIRTFLTCVNKQSYFNSLNTQIDLKKDLNLPLHLKIMSEMEETFFKHLSINEERLFDDYIKYKLNQKKSVDYPSEKTTKKHLIWLSKKLTEQKQREFLIEKMQPSWLEYTYQRWIYRILFGLSAGIIFGIISGMIIPLVEGSFQKDANTLIVQIITGLMSALISVLIYGDVNEIILFEAFQLSWGKFGEIWRNPIDLLLNDLIILIFLIFINRTLFDNGSSFFVIGTVLTLPITALITGIKSHDIKNRKIPNQGIFYSVYDAIFISLITFAIFVFFYILVFYFLKRGEFNPRQAITVGMSFGLFSGFIFGGFAAIQHLILRLILWSNGSIPWNYSKFLCYASERGFILQVGGRYSFIHDLLREYFADRYTEKG
jgi:hypothetical protein